jgi:hypothetical protein
MSRVVRRCTLFPFGVLLLWPALFGQAVLSATEPSTFHISGAITAQYGQSFAVVFDGASPKTVVTNEAGVYEANLPLGLWTMTVVAHDPDGKIYTKPIYYRRPPFRVTKPTSFVFDVSLPIAMGCTVMVVSPDGGPATQEEQDQVKAWCAGEEFFPVPSDGVPFEVHVWGGSKFASCSLVGRGDNGVACKREFATYNTLSVQADEVDYDPHTGILEAYGDVVSQDESGEHKAPSMTFDIHDGQTVPMQQDR